MSSCRELWNRKRQHRVAEMLGNIPQNQHFLAVSEVGPRKELLEVNINNLRLRMLTPHDGFPVFPSFLTLIWSAGAAISQTLQVLTSGSSFVCNSWTAANGPLAMHVLKKPKAILKEAVTFDVLIFLTAGHYNIWSVAHFRHSSHQSCFQ